MSHETKRSARVLVIEDDADSRVALGIILTEFLGQDVLEAEGGAAGLAAAAAHSPHLVLVDIGLQDVDGYVVAAKLRALDPRVRLVAVTGCSKLDDRPEAGCFDAHLVKPITPKQLEEQLALCSSCAE